MAATRYSSSVLEMFYGSTIDEENRNLPQPMQPVVVGRYNGFVLAQNNFENGFVCGKWLYQKIMNTSQIV